MNNLPEIEREKRREERKRNKEMRITRTRMKTKTEKLISSTHYSTTTTSSINTKLNRES